MNIDTSFHELFKGLSDPTRLRIAVLLLSGEICVCDVTAVLQLPQPTISRHMGNLKAAGVVTDRREGRWIHYRLAESEPLNSLREYFESLQKEAPFSEDLARLITRKREVTC